MSLSYHLSTTPQQCAFKKMKFSPTPDSLLPKMVGLDANSWGNIQLYTCGYGINKLLVKRSGTRETWQDVYLLLVLM